MTLTRDRPLIPVSKRVPIQGPYTVDRPLIPVSKRVPIQGTPTTSTSRPASGGGTAGGSTGTGSVTTTTHNPPTAPFLTPEQELSRINENVNYQISVGDIQGAMQSMRERTAFQQQVNARDQLRSERDLNENLAGRGVFDSSIRIGDLADLSQTYSLRNTALLTALHTAETNAANRIGALTFGHEQALNQFNLMELGNALDHPAAPDTTTTTPGTSGTGSTSGTGGTPPTNTMGGGHPGGAPGINAGTVPTFGNGPQTVPGNPGTGPTPTVTPYLAPSQPVTAGANPPLRPR